MLLPLTEQIPLQSLYPERRGESPRRANNASLLRRLHFFFMVIGPGNLGSLRSHRLLWRPLRSLVLRKPHFQGHQRALFLYSRRSCPHRGRAGVRLSGCHAAGSGVALWVPRSCPHLRLLFIAVARYLPGQSGELSSSSTSPRRVAPRPCPHQRGG